MRSARYREQREGIWRRRLRVVVALALVGGVVFLATTKLEWHRPTGELLHPVDALGRTSTIDVHLADAQTGLSRARVEIEAGGTRTVLASEDYPAASWRRSTAMETTLSVPLQAIERKIPEGPATIRVYADDYSWLRFVRGERPTIRRQRNFCASESQPCGNLRRSPPMAPCSNMRGVGKPARR